MNVLVNFPLKIKLFKTITKYLAEQNYYTHADVHSKLALPISEFEKFEIYDEKSSDLISRHKNLIKLMKTKFSKDQNFFLYLHYEKIHTGIVNSVLKSYTNFSEEYFKFMLFLDEQLPHLVFCLRIEIRL